MRAALVAADIQRVVGASQPLQLTTETEAVLEDAGRADGAGDSPAPSLTVITPRELLLLARCGRPAVCELRSRLRANQCTRGQWLLVGRLRCRADGFWLCDAADAAVQCVFLDAAAPCRAVNCWIVVAHWTLPPSQAGAPTCLEVSRFSLLERDSGNGREVHAGSDRTAFTCNVVSVSPVLRVQGTEFAVAVRSRRPLVALNSVVAQHLTPPSVLAGGDGKRSPRTRLSHRRSAVAAACTWWHGRQSQTCGLDAFEAAHVVPRPTRTQRPCVVCPKPGAVLHPGRQRER